MVIIYAPTLLPAQRRSYILAPPPPTLRASHGERLNTGFHTFNGGWAMIPNENIPERSRYF
jgi:hypothetical protein